MHDPTKTDLLATAFPVEVARAAAMSEYGLLDTPPEERFDRIARLASFIFAAPIALIALADTNRIWFKSRLGFDYEELAYDIAFCTHALADPETFVVMDAARDPRFSRNRLVTGPSHLRFYAGAQLRNRDGLAIGVLCVVDTEPRDPSPEMIAALEDLAQGVAAEFELSRMTRLLEAELVAHQSSARELALSHARVLRLSEEDPVTGLFNRRAFQHHLNEAVAQSRLSGIPGALLMVDLDRFKLVNDTHGHGAGDRLLQTAADRIRQAVGTGGRVARIGGDEFGIVLPAVDLRSASLVGQQIVTLMGAEIDVDGRRLRTGCSVGIAQIVPDGATGDVVLGQADLALYEAKHGGRGRTSLFSPDHRMRQLVA